MKLDKQLEIKKQLGLRAAELVREGMLVGLGSGTTATCFIESLIERASRGLAFKAVSSSIHSAKLARQGGIHVLEMEDVEEIDLTVDGADEIDPENRMIKGGGGAHVREKILASSSRQMVVIVDESKLVDTLGAFGLPVECLPFGFKATLHKLKAAGFDGQVRLDEDGQPFITDNGNFLFDIHTPSLFSQPEKTHERLIEIPGLIDTGFFFHLASRVLVGYADGRIDFR